MPDLTYFDNLGSMWADSSLLKIDSVCGICGRKMQRIGEKRRCIYECPLINENWHKD